MLRVATFNINGIRAAQRRGFEDWLARRDPDVVTLQEVRCPVEALPPGVFAGRYLAYDPGNIKGRNGVAVLTRTRPAAIRAWGGQVMVSDGTASYPVATQPVQTGVTLARELREFAQSGRYVEVDLADVPLTVASLYLPKGGLPAELQQPNRMRQAPDGGAKFETKMRFLAGFARHVDRARRAARAGGRHYLLTGDLNVAHTRSDVTNWRTSNRAEGFLPQEREWLGGLLGPRRLVDVLRTHHGDVQGPYSWWSWMGQSFAKDVGWRIDYQLATPALARAAVWAGVDRDADPATRISDHAPVVVDYDLSGDR